MNRRAIKFAAEVQGALIILKDVRKETGFAEIFSVQLEICSPSRFGALFSDLSVEHAQ
jgi:hypothetical protein